MNKADLSARIVNLLKELLPAGGAVALHEPVFEGNEWSYVKSCIDDGWVSSAGAYVDRFEKMLADYTGAGYAVATVNGTAALHVCLLLAGVTAGSEVLLPALTFVATANAVAYTGAIPHFIDIEEATLGVDTGKLSGYLDEIGELRSGQLYNRLTGRPISALVPMHTFGHPVDMDPLLALAESYGLDIIEDAAESIGSLYKGRHTGTLAPLGCLSFNGNKTITTGGGGAILTGDLHLANKARHLTTQAKVVHAWDFNHDMTGYNYRLPNINAALGCAQLERLESLIARKRKMAAHYEAAFAKLDGVDVFHEAGFARSNYWLNALLLEKPDRHLLEDVLKRCNAEGIMARPVWTLMQNLPMYTDCPRMDLEKSQSLVDRIINVPSSASLCHIKKEDAVNESGVQDKGV